MRTTVDERAAALLDAQARGVLLAPPSDADHSFDLAAAYAVGAAITARGARRAHRGAQDWLHQCRHLGGVWRRRAALGPRLRHHTAPRTRRPRRPAEGGGHNGFDRFPAYWPTVDAALR